MSDTVPVTVHEPELGEVRQWHIDALTRRAALHHGAVRRVLEDKLRCLREAQVQVPLQAGLPTPSPKPDQQQPLTDLLAHITRQTSGVPPAGGSLSGTSGLPSRAQPLELKAIRDYRATWSRLSAERRLHQALAKVPDNAGPLNTQRLLHQALRLMHNASPAYLLRFMAHAESLLALDAINQRLPALPATKLSERRPKRGA